MTRIKDRFPNAGRKLTAEEKARVDELHKKYENMSIEDSPFMKRARERGTNGHGKASEKRLAKSIGARLTPNSGATRGAKGDMSMGDFLIESKSTIHGSMSVEQGWLNKITHEAMASSKKPALTVSFVTPEGKPQPGTNEWVMVPMYVLQELLEK